MAKKRKSYEMHIVSHTHWDREWRLTFQQFRMKLVDCLDHLLELLDRDPNYRHFNLDGQTVLLEDYLEVRPENRETVSRYIREGRITAGPWYTLVDESSLHGESLIRNLLTGHQVAESLGGVMKIGSGISSFGHIGQLPQIFAGFEIDNVIFSRGISDWQVKSEFIWESPDGTRALALHLPDNYTKSNWFYVIYRPNLAQTPATCWDYTWGTLGLPFHACDPRSIHQTYRLLDPQLAYDPDAVYRSVLQLRDECAALATTKHLLFMDGVDHLEPNPYLSRIIEDVNARLEGGDVLIHSTLPAFVAKVKKAVAGRRLQVFRGEMRRPTREGIHNPLMGHVPSARMYLKQQNERAQVALARLAEPMASLAWLLGFPYPGSCLDIAWRYLMKNHAHDSICGCSIDAVHDEMEHRFAQATTIADELTQRVFWQVVPEINLSALDEDAIALVLFNPCVFPRTEVVTLAVDFPMGWGVREFVLRDASGRELPYQLHSKQRVSPEILNPLNAQLNAHMDRLWVSFVAGDILPVGWTMFAATPRRGRPKKHLGSMVPRANVMENEHLRVEIQPDGTLDLTEKATGRVTRGLHFFEDGGDGGDAWTYRPPDRDRIVSSLGCPVRISLVDNGPILARYRIDYEIALPECALPPKERPVPHEAGPVLTERSERLIPYTIASYVTLARGARRVDITTCLDNRAKDHRLRVLFPSAIAGATVSAAESQFDVVERPIQLPDTSGWREQAHSTHPQLGFVNVSDGEVGLAILNEGLAEYAVLDDKVRTIALTLLRCTGKSIGSDDEQQGAQCLRKFEFRYAIYPHVGKWDKAELFQQSIAHNTPLKACLTRRHDKGSLPATASFLSVEPNALILSALKKSGAGDSLVVRLYNPTDRPVNGTIRSPTVQLAKARQVNFLEQPKGNLRVERGKSVRLRVGAKKIVTVELRFKRP